MKSFKIGKIKIKNKGVLAPMLEYTHLPFRLLCKDYGCGLTYTEMVHTNHIVHFKENISEIKPLLSNKKDTPTSLQLVGNLNNYDEVLKAAEIIDNYKFFDIIDFNLGCPSNRIISGNSGSALLKNIDSVLKPIKDINSITKKPFTLKIRLGFLKNNIEEISEKLINCNISALAIHGRTQQDNYSTPSNYKIVEKIAKQSPIPIIYNGDVNLNNLEDFINNDYFSGIMIGRGALSNPTIFKNIEKNKYNINYKNNKEIITKFINYSKKYNLDLIKQKINLLNLIKFGENSRQIKNQISNCKTQEELEGIVLNIN